MGWKKHLCKFFIDMDLGVAIESNSKLLGRWATIDDWCRDNIPAGRIWYSEYILVESSRFVRYWFESNEDLMAFKLVWGEYEN